MEAEIARRFRAGELAPSSSVREIKHIGPYLGARLRDAFNPRARELTIRVLARRIAPSPTCGGRSAPGWAQLAPPGRESLHGSMASGSSRSGRPPASN